MSNGTERRRADAQRSVDAILRAARDVWAEDSGAGLQRVAERAQVHRTTVFRHFPTRDALIEALHNAAIDDAEAAALQIDLDAADLLAEVEAFTRRIYDLNLAWRTHGWAPGYSSRTPERRRRERIGEMTTALFDSAQRQGLLRRDLDLRELLAVWGGPVIYLTGNVAEGNWTLDEVIAFTMRVLTTPSGCAPGTDSRETDR